MLKHEVIEKTLSKGFADSLDEVIIDHGALVFSRRDLIETLGTGNFAAALKLNRALKKLDIKTPAELNKLDPFSLLRIKSVGERTVFVAMCILDAAGYSVERWWGWKQDKDNLVKFSSYKAKAVRKTSKQKQEV